MPAIGVVGNLGSTVANHRHRNRLASQRIVFEFTIPLSLWQMYACSVEQSASLHLPGDFLCRAISTHSFCNREIHAWTWRTNGRRTYRQTYRCTDVWLVYHPVREVYDVVVRPPEVVVPVSVAQADPCVRLEYVELASQVSWMTCNRWEQCHKTLGNWSRESCPTLELGCVNGDEVGAGSLGSTAVSRRRPVQVFRENLVTLASYDRIDHNNNK